MRNRTLPPPGVGAARGYAWLLTGPVLLLVAGIVLTAVGLAYDSEGVATIGPLGIVASLILPRMKGPFEVRPGWS